MFALTPIAAASHHELLELVNAVWAADGVPMALAPEEIADFVEGPHFNPETDGRVVVADGKVIAFGLVHCRPTDEKDAWAYISGGVHPARRGQGVGRLLVEWQLERAAERLAYAEGRLHQVIRVEIHPGENSKRSTMGRYGFAPVRYFDEMIRQLTDVPDPSPRGFELIAWDPSRNEETRAVKNAAFRDHWGSTPIDAATWQHWLDDYGTRLDLSFMAIADGSVIGYSLNGHYPQDEAIRGRREGWIENLGTLQSWRGRGVATALMCASFEAFARAGFSHAALGVDTENPTGAHGLYTRIGFELDYQTVMAQRPL